MSATRIYPGWLPGRFIDRLALVAVVVLALVVRFNGITVPAIWLDEAFSVLLARYEPSQIWFITARDVHPPLYYLILHYWMILFGDGVLSVRSLGAIADVGTVLLSIKLISLVATRRATWIAGLLLALLPILVRYSQEARMYTLLSFWLMSATVALVCWVKDIGKTRFPVFYVLLMTAAFYTHYLAALCVLVHWFYWWWGRPGIFLTALPTRSWILANAAIVVGFLPWLPHFIDQWADKPAWMPPVTVQAVVSLVWQFIVMNGWGSQSLYLRAIPLVLVVACAAVLIWKDRSQHRYMGLVLGYFFIPAVVLVLLALFGPIFVPRYLIFAGVGLPLIIAAAMDVLVRRTAILALFVLVVAAVEVQGLQSVYRQADDLNGTDLRRDVRLDVVAREIKKMAQPGDEIVFESLFWYLPFDVYNRTTIRPRLRVHLPIDDFLKVSDRGIYAVIPKSLEWIYFDDPNVLKCRGRRVWWIAIRSSVDVKTLLVRDWKLEFSFVEGPITVSLYALKSKLPQLATRPSELNAACVFCASRLSARLSIWHNERTAIRLSDLQERSVMKSIVDDG